MLIGWFHDLLIFKSGEFVGNYNCQCKDKNLEVLILTIIIHFWSWYWVIKFVTHQINLILQHSHTQKMYGFQKVYWYYLTINFNNWHNWLLKLKLNISIFLFQWNFTILFITIYWKSNLFCHSFATWDWSAEGCCVQI
jgi:hypothetical protein